jgi:hypothetical protein
MIYFGLDNEAKGRVISELAREHSLSRIVMCSPERFSFALPGPGETVDWPEIIMYRTFYRLLREIDERTLLVINECLRTQNRYDLTYNCIRHYCNRAGMIVVFQWLPLIDTIDDFMTLFDFVTGSRWKREPFDPDLLTETTITGSCRAPKLSAEQVAIDAALRGKYEAEKRSLFSSLGAKDPHTLPRTLHLLPGKAKLLGMWPDRSYVGRNTRFKRNNLVTYRETAYQNGPYTVFEWPHNFIDFADFLCLSGQTDISALTTDLPVDRWYFERYRDWSQRVAYACASLSIG